MPDSSGEKLCPICDSPLQPGSKKCGFCGTDLSIFDIDIEPIHKEPEPVPQPQPKVSLDSRVDEILKPRAPERPAQAPFSEPPKRTEPIRYVTPAPQPVKAEPPPKPIIQEAPKPAPVQPKQEASPAPEPAQEEFFECPQCGTPVPIDAKSCQKCGVMFAEEGAEVFECPACSTLVPIDAKTCPGCGAVFVESEEAASAAISEAEPEPVVPKKGLEPAIQEVKPAKPQKAEEEGEAKPAEKGKGFLGGLFKRKKEAEEPKEEAKPEKPAAKEKPVPSSESRIPPTPQKKVEKVTPAVEMKPSPMPAPAVRRIEPVASPAVKDKGKELARMVAEMKPLLALAREKEIDIGDSKNLIDEAALAGRERQLDKAIELVERSKRSLMEKVDAQLEQLVGQLNEEIKVAKDFGGDISRASTYVQELTKARASGDVEAAYVYVDKVQKELLPITGRYNESKKKLGTLKQFIADSEMFIVDTKEARRLHVDANRAFDQKDFDKTENLVRQANESLNKAIPTRMNDEMKKAKFDLTEAKMRNVNITPMLTILKSATNLMKSGDYAQAMKEMREFKDMMKRSA